MCSLTAGNSVYPRLNQPDNFIVLLKLGNAHKGKEGYAVTVSLRKHHSYSGTEKMMGTKLERIAEISAATKKPEFTNLYHLINAELLKQCHRELNGKKAVGIDKVTKEEYVS